MPTAASSVTAMAFGARETKGKTLQRSTRRREHHVRARGPEPDDHQMRAHEVGVVVAFLELRTAGTFGASTLRFFLLHVP